MEWNRTLGTILLQEYKKHDCLYNFKSRYYYNKKSRLQALTDIMNVLKTHNERVTLFDVKKKINLLRSQFSAEMKKIKRCENNLMPYLPSAWWYPLMTFIKDITDSRQSTLEMRKVGEDLPADTVYKVEIDDTDSNLFNDSQFIDTDSCQNVADTNDTLAQSSPNQRVESKSSKKTETSSVDRDGLGDPLGLQTDDDESLTFPDDVYNNRQTEAETKTTQRSQKCLNTDKADDAFGVLVAEKLKMIRDSRKKVDVQMKIMTIILEAEKDGID